MRRNIRHRALQLAHNYSDDEDIDNITNNNENEDDDDDSFNIESGRSPIGMTNSVAGTLLNGYVDDENQCLIRKAPRSASASRYTETVLFYNMV